eukprot:GILK01001541.1.p1 GENE.GILK01001541.1~~GILK01001541.1.p1  ORF type:complete len:470 (-),score=70.38 GILK01001541.1:121-1467(-)
MTMRLRSHSGNKEDLKSGVEPTVRNSPTVRRVKTLKKNTFKSRTSKFDMQQGSSIQESEFRGFYNLFALFLVFFIITQPLNNWIDKGYLMHWGLWNNMTRDLMALGIAWFCMFVWSFTALFLQKAILAGLPPFLVLVCQHGSQAAMMAVMIVLSVARGWSVGHTGFIVVQSIVHFMKMHSYTMTNRDLAIAAREKKKNDAETKEEEEHAVTYPENVNVQDFAYYMVAPTLVYEPHFPRTERFRIGYFMEKSIAMLGCVLVLYFVSTQYIIPVVEISPKLSIAETIIKLIIPYFLCYLLFFFMVFECYLNAVAELTRFADREFYLDWWNSTTFDEFARKWNRPVHEFLLRHVYIECIQHHRMSQGLATFITFLFSACVHEMLLAVVFLMIRPYLFVLMMIQIPLIYFGRLPIFKGTRFGNLFFWFGISLGQPLLLALYSREWMILHHSN